jgi:hypothetical protein
LTHFNIVDEVVHFNLIALVTALSTTEYD